MAAPRGDPGRTAGGYGGERHDGGYDDPIDERSGVQAAGVKRVHHDHNAVFCQRIQRFHHDDGRSRRIHHHDSFGRRNHHDVDPFAGRSWTSAGPHGPDATPRQLEQPSIHHDRGRLEHRLGIQMHTGTSRRTIVSGVRDAGGLVSHRNRRDQRNRTVGTIGHGAVHPGSADVGGASPSKLHLGNQGYRLVASPDGQYSLAGVVNRGQFGFEDQCSPVSDSGFLRWASLASSSSKKL